MKKFEFPIQERRAFWDARFADSSKQYRPEVCAAFADNCLAERDKRFPAPEGGE